MKRVWCTFTVLKLIRFSEECSQIILYIFKWSNAGIWESWKLEGTMQKFWKIWRTFQRNIKDTREKWIGNLSERVFLIFLQIFFELFHKILLFYLKSFLIISQGSLKSKSFRSFPKTIPRSFIFQDFCNTKIPKYFSVITLCFQQFFQNFRGINSMLPPNFLKTLLENLKFFWKFVKIFQYEMISECLKILSTYVWSFLKVS